MSAPFPRTVSSLPTIFTLSPCYIIKEDQYQKLIISSIRVAPAAPAVQYETVKFNVTVKDNPFVGAGSEVDKAWREISYDSMSFFLYLTIRGGGVVFLTTGKPVVVEVLTYCSGRSDDIRE